MKTVTIDQLLTWAFTQELWKVGAGGGVSAVGRSNYSAIIEYGETMALIDRDPNHFGVIPGFEEGDPHEDALAAGAAVKMLADLGVMTPPEGWRVFPEVDDQYGVIADEVRRVLGEWRSKGARSAGEHLVGLMVRCAVMERGPDWRADPPRVVPVLKWGNPAWFIMRRRRDSLGRWYEYETDGFDVRKRRPFKGAYRKYRLADPLRGAILGRLDWWLWREAAKMLHSRLKDRLLAHRLSDFVDLPAPWTILEVDPQAIEKAS